MVRTCPVIQVRNRRGGFLRAPVADHKLDRERPSAGLCSIGAGLLTERSGVSYAPVVKYCQGRFYSATTWAVYCILGLVLDMLNGTGRV